MMIPFWLLATSRFGILFCCCILLVGVWGLSGCRCRCCVVQKDINSCCGARLVQELELGSLLLFFFCVIDIGLD